MMMIVRDGGELYEDNDGLELEEEDNEADEIVR